MDPQILLYGGVAALGVGVLVVLALLAAGGKRPEEIDVEARVRAYTQGGRRAAAAPSSVLEAATQRAESALAGSKTLEAKIAHRLDGAASSLKPAEWLLLHAGIFVATGFVFFLLMGGNPVGAVIGLAIGGVGPWFWLGLKRSRRVKAFQQTLPETLQLMSGSLSAGLSLAQSIDTIVREGGEPITSEFRRVVVESRLGVTLEDALEGVADRMESKDFGWVVMAIRIQRDVGGNLAELLLTVANTLREREYIRRHVRALSAEGRLSAYVLGGLPPVFLIYLSLTKWTYVKPLFTEPIGFAILGVMTVLLTVGSFWMSKVAKVSV